MAWWQHRDQFDWFSGYLRDRGLQRQWRVSAFVFTIFLGAVPVVVVGSTAGPDSVLARSTAIAASVAALAVSTLWLFRWPTRVQSLVYSAVCCGCIAVGCLLVPNPYGGLMGCTMFATIGGFIAYFHAFVHVVANFAVAMVCAGIAATRMFADSGDILLVAASCVVVLGLNIGVPFGILSLVHSLHTDLRDSDRDPLTGLLNRRSFYKSAHELIAAQHRSRGVQVNVTMVDLDDFKSLNDTRGHAVGDQALVSVGDVLQAKCAPGAVLARLGGEEFVIADTETPRNHAVTADRIRAGIAASPFQITASLGTCSAAVAPGASIAHPQFIDTLIRLADSAMYESKRAGGNQIQHWYLDHDGAVSG